jgi:2-C-methyl-D-erythritol 4-phosphate cytidylyltransferase
MIDVIILAAGESSRSEVNKATLKIDNENLINLQIKKWIKNKYVNKIILVVNKFNEKLIDKSLAKEIIIVNGGPTRYISSYNGITASCSEFVAIHDMARPYTKIQIDEKLVDRLFDKGILIPYNLAVDSIFNSSDECYLERDNIWLVSTPQFFRREKILKAYNYSAKSDNNYTDDYSVYSLLYGFNKNDFFLLKELNSKITFGEKVEDYYY